VLNYGLNVTSLAFSPDNRLIAVLELVKDEYGDIRNKKLAVLSMSSRKAKTLAVGRRKPAFAWAGNTSLAVTRYDKYAVPTLSLITVDGRVTKLVSNRSVARLIPLGFVGKSDFVVYKSDSSAMSGDGEQVLWKVRPGSPPIRLFPKEARK